jgi:hypothetical protein
MSDIKKEYNKKYYEANKQRILATNARYLRTPLLQLLPVGPSVHFEPWAESLGVPKAARKRGLAESKDLRYGNKLLDAGRLLTVPKWAIRSQAPKGDTAARSNDDAYGEGPTSRRLCGRGG